MKFREFLSSMKQIFAQKGRWLVAIFTIGGISMFVIFGSMFYLSSKLEDDFHIKGVLKGLILAIPLLALCITSFITGKYIQDNKRLMKWLSFTGCVVQTAAITAGATVDNIYLLVSALFLGGAGIGLVLPCLDSLITGGSTKRNVGQSPRCIAACATLESQLGRRRCPSCRKCRTRRYSIVSVDCVPYRRYFRYLLSSLERTRRKPKMYSTSIPCTVVLGEANPPNQGLHRPFRCVDTSRNRESLRSKSRPPWSGLDD
ncbi:MFS transporter [Alicyclobacillus fastidiosus]|uniref:MFS transporter n=1 Tax=Alicyclobacillus fastidiosus TaxID=392011 RepID=UPI003D66F5F6